MCPPLNCTAVNRDNTIGITTSSEQQLHDTPAPSIARSRAIRREFGKVRGRAKSNNLLISHRRIKDRGLVSMSCLWALALLAVASTSQATTYYRQLPIGEAHIHRCLGSTSTRAPPGPPTSHHAMQASTWPAPTAPASFSPLELALMGPTPLRRRRARVSHAPPAPPGWAASPATRAASGTLPPPPRSTTAPYVQQALSRSTRGRPVGSPSLPMGTLTSLA